MLRHKTAKQMCGWPGLGPGGGVGPKELAAGGAYGSVACLDLMVIPQLRAFTTVGGILG